MRYTRSRFALGAAPVPRAVGVLVGNRFVVMAGWS
jgi:hypothetical protein